MLTQMPEELQLFICILKPPDVERLMMNWVDYTNNFPFMCGHEKPRKVPEYFRKNR